MTSAIELRRITTGLLGVAGGALAGFALGTAWGGGLLVLVVIAVAVVAIFVASWRPLSGVALVPVTVGLGNDPVPGAPLDLQAVHASIGLAVGGVLLHLLLADHPRLRRPTAPVARALAAVGAFVLVNTVSGLLGQTPLISLTLNLTLFATALLAAAVALVVTSHEELRALLCVIVASSVAATAPVLGQTGTVEAERGGTVVDNRPTGAFVDANELGAFSAVVVVLALVLLCSRRPWERAIGAVGGGFALVALVLSFSRGAWIAAAVGSMLLLAVPALTARVLRVLAGAAALGFSVLAAGLLPLPLDAVQARAETLLSGAANPYDVRPVIWQTAIATAFDHPWLGAGPGSFSRVAAEAPGILWSYPVVHAHNGALTTAAETGLVGLLGAVAVVCTVAAGLIGRARRLPRSADGAWATTCGLLVALCTVGATLVVDYTLRNPLVLMNVWLLVGAGIAAAQVEEHVGRAPAGSSSDARRPSLAAAGRDRS